MPPEVATSILLLWDLEGAIAYDDDMVLTRRQDHHLAAPWLLSFMPNISG